MRYERPSSGDATEPRGEPEHATDEPCDERELYGEPCHEVATERDEQTLYGEPQHEPRQRDDGIDPDLLFACLRLESFAGPEASASREPSAAGVTER